MGDRYFTLPEANAQIPQLEQAFSAVMQIRAQLKRLFASLDDAGYPPSQEDEEDGPPTDAPDEVLDDRAKFYGLVEALREMVDEIHETGCQIKDIETGLVDWRARSGGRDVLLCWKLGEREIGYYHELSTGFDGRRPVTELDPSVVRGHPRDPDHDRDAPIYDDDEPSGLLH